MKITVATTTEQLVSLREEWKILETESRATVFQTWDWTMQWWKVFGSQKGCMAKGLEKGDAVIYAFKSEYALSVYCAWEGPTLIAVVPMVFRKFKQREMGMAGMDDQEYHGPLCRVRHAGILPHLAARIAHDFARSEAMTLDVRGITSHDRFASMLGAELSDLPMTRIPYSHCPVLDLQAWSRQGVSGRIRRMLAKGERAAESLKDRLWIGPLDHDRASASADHLIDILKGRWQDKGVYSVFHVQGHESFFRGLLKGMSEDSIKTFGAVLDDRIAAFAVCLFHGPRCYYWLPGRRADVLDSLPLGHMLISNIIDYAQARGCTHLDFLRGSHPYKLEWGALTEVSDRVVISKDPLGAHTLEGLTYPLGDTIPGHEHLKDHECTRTVIIQEPKDNGLKRIG